MPEQVKDDCDFRQMSHSSLLLLSSNVDYFRILESLNSGFSVPPYFSRADSEIYRLFRHSNCTCWIVNSFFFFSSATNVSPCLPLTFLEFWGFNSLENCQDGISGRSFSPRAAIQDSFAIEARFITAIPAARCVIRADLTAAPVAESARDLSSPRRRAFRHGCLPRGWSYVVINQKVDAKGAVRVGGNDRRKANKNVFRFLRAKRRPD